MSELKFAVVFSAAVALAAGSTAALAAGNAEAGKAKSTACGACHGPDGNSVNPEWPKLAGQTPAYLVKQLNEFKSGRRANDLMSPMAKPLSDQDIEDLAAYFSSQKVQAGKPAGTEVALGQKLYREGNARPPVTACTGCHGQTGAGNVLWDAVPNTSDAVRAPALGGQHAVYVAKQLKAFRAGTRGNDVGSIMRTVSFNLTDKDIDAVADYITGLER